MTAIRHSLLLAHHRIDITSACVGSGQCVVVGGGMFEMDDDGKSEFGDVGAGILEVEQARLAAAACPTGAIEVVTL